MRYQNRSSVSSGEDRTPVFHSSKKMTVTGMRLLVRRSVYPLSSVAGVTVVNPPWSELFDSLKLSAAAGLLFLVFAFGPEMLIDKSSRLMSYASVVGLLGTALFAIVSIGLFVAEKRIRIQLVSGDAVMIKSLDAKTAEELHAAIDRAMTYRANTADRAPSVSDELSKLASLMNQGAISEDEWQRAKDLFLGKQPTAQELAVRQLSQLHELWRSGVLSESEFNTKKWELLVQSGA